MNEKNRIFRPLNRKDGIEQKVFERAVRNVMSYYMGFRRNDKGMRLALEKLNFIGEHASQIKAENYHELLRAHEALFMHKVSILTTLSCLQRKESGRAIYKRSDFPDTNPDMNKPLVIWQDEGRVNFSWGT